MNFGAGLLGGFGIYVVKPLVLLFCFILIMRFRKLKVTGGRLIWLGLWSFFIGEMICAVESYVIFRISATLDILHSIFSASALALITLGLFDFFDRYYLHYINGEKPCFFIRFCEECPRKTRGKCKFHGVIIWSVILIILLSFAPLFSEVTEIKAYPADHQLPWQTLNDFYDQKLVPFLEKYIGGYSQSDLFLTISYESRFVLDRFFPWMALLVMIPGLILLLLNKADRWVVVLFSIGTGAIGFSYFEIILYKVNPYVFIGSVGEELAELAGLFLLMALLKQMRGKSAAAETKNT